MKIYNSPIKLYNNINTYNTPVSFKGYSVPTLTHTNIGSCMNGYIGKVRVWKASNSEEFLNVFKTRVDDIVENYSLTNDKGDLIGEITFGIKKALNYDREIFPEDPSHVFVTKLRNYSNPHTPYYTYGLEHYKDVGKRLMQIAQRRSDEALCNGNIKLVSTDESKDWYKAVIGMVEEFPHTPNTVYNGKSLNVHNPYVLILPPAKEPLSRLAGGL